MDETMKILFISAVNHKNNIEVAFPSLGLAYLASSLKKNFPDINIKITDRDYQNTIKLFKPDFVGISSVSQNFGTAENIGRFCLQQDIPVIIGGVHITLLPQSFSEAFTLGVVGEGEDTIVELVKHFKENKGFNLKDIDAIDGLVFFKDGNIKLTSPRRQISELDSLGLPDRELLNIPQNQTTYMFTSRGCPYTCSFCASTRLWENNVRWFSAEHVVNEIEEIVDKYKPWAISFYDDLFTANLKRLKKIVKLICLKGINKKVKFSFACRSNLVNEKLIDILRPLSIQMICMGLESGNQRVLTYLKSPGITVAQHKKAIKLFHDAGINIQGTFIIGSPGETEYEIRQTLNFIKESKLKNFDVYILTPFPGTPVWEKAMRMGLVADNMDWNKLSVTNIEDKIILSELGKDKIVELYSYFMREKKIKRISYITRRLFCDPRWLLDKAKGILPAMLNNNK